MSLYLVSYIALKDFVDVFLRAEGSGEEPSSQIWGQVEELARRTIRQIDRIKRPADVNPLDWEKAHECMSFAAHSIVDKDKRGVVVTHVLGFLPIIADTMDGAIEKMTSTWKLDALSRALQYKYEHALKIHPFWITHDVLEGADAKDIQLFLQALVSGKDANPMWHSPESMICENMCVRIFYLPVVYTVHGTMEPDWSPDEVYEPCDFSEKGEDAFMDAFEEAFTLHGDEDTRIQTYDIGLSIQVTNEAQTQRDLREIDTRLEMLKTNITMREKSAHEVRLEIQLTWGAGLGSLIEPEEAPAVRFIAFARNLEDDVAHRFTLGVHIDEGNPQSWNDVLQRLLAICFRVGWPNVEIKQVSNTQAINFWTEANAPTRLM